MPPTIDTTAMRNVTPIVTPSTVKKLLSFCTAMVSQARRTAWRKSMDGWAYRRIGVSAYRRIGVWPKRKRRGASHTPTRPTPIRPEKLQAQSARKDLPLLVRRDEAVAQHDHAPRMRGDVRLVRDHHDRLAGAREHLEHLHDLF